MQPVLRGDVSGACAEPLGPPSRASWADPLSAPKGRGVPPLLTAFSRCSQHLWAAFSWSCRAATVWSPLSTEAPGIPIGQKMPRAVWCGQSLWSCHLSPGVWLSVLPPTCGRGGLGGALQGWWSSGSREKAAVGRGGQHVSCPCQAAGPQLCEVDGLMSYREWVSTCNIPPLPHTLSRTSCTASTAELCVGDSAGLKTRGKDFLSHSPLRARPWTQDITQQSLQPCLANCCMFTLYWLISIFGYWSSSDTGRCLYNDTIPQSGRDYFSLNVD